MKEHENTTPLDPAELVAANIYYRDLYDHAPVGYCSVSESGLILEANVTAAALLGASRAMLVGTAIEQHIHTADQDTLRRHRETLLNTGAPQTCAVRIVRADGSRRWVQMEGSIGRKADGSATFRCVMIDITDKRETEGALEQALTELSVIYRHAPIAMMLVDRARNVSTINEKAARFAGVSPSDAIGSSTGETLRCLAALDDPRGCGFGPRCEQCMIRKAVHDTFTDRANRTEIEAWIPIASDSGEKCLLVSTAYIEYGEDAQVLVSTQDITARKRVLEQLQQHVQEKEILLREIHHRVKNNLNVISSLVSIQSSAIRTPEQALSAFHNTRDRIAAMALVHEDLYTSQDYSHVDMVSYLKNLVRKIQLAHDPSGRVAIHLSVGEVSLGVDIAVPCGIILNELITNAFKYAFPGEREGGISVRLDENADGNHTLSVCDDGVGLPEDYHRDGSLGLTLVHLLAEQLGGTIESCSLDEHPSCGTCFCLHFRGSVKR